MTRPTLSIVVTTKNRAETAVITARNVLRIAGDDLEIIVQDCSDDDRLRVALTPALIDRRLHYSYAGEPLSMAENWNRAAALFRGDYVLFIGDDDAVVAEALAVARWARRGNLQAVTYARSAYTWPNWPIRQRAGWLTLQRCTGNVTWTKPQASLDRALTRREYFLDGLPQIYHGLVCRDLLHEVRRRTGHYFDGLCPDYFASIAMATLVERCAVLDYPLSILGYSGSSNSARNQRGGLGQHVKEYGGFAVSPILPPTTTAGDLDICVVDSLVRALEQMGRIDLIRHAPITRAYGGYMIDHPCKLPAVWRRFLAARRELGIVTGTGDNLLELGRGVARRLVQRGRAYVAYRVPTAVLRMRHFQSFRAREVDEAATIQAAVLRRAGVAPMLDDPMIAPSR